MGYLQCNTVAGKILRNMTVNFVFWATLAIWGVATTEIGSSSSVVNCAACRSVQMQVDSWQCKVNCHVISGQNGK